MKGIWPVKNLPFILKGFLPERMEEED